MTRQIKFRGLRSDGKGWVCGDLMCNWTIPQIFSEEDGNEYPVIPSSVGQFTGLTDRNGTEIYEGDVVYYTTIVKTDETGNNMKYKGVIQFWIGQTGCGWRYKSNRYTLMIKRSHSWSMEVIGNIHES